MEDYLPFVQLTLKCFYPLASQDICKKCMNSYVETSFVQDCSKKFEFIHLFWVAVGVYALKNLHKRSVSPGSTPGADRGETESAGIDGYGASRLTVLNRPVTPSEPCTINPITQSAPRKTTQVFLL